MKIFCKNSLFLIGVFLCGYILIYAQEIKYMSTNNVVSSDLWVPIAPKKPKKLVKHKDVRIDDYFWLNDRNDPEVIAYLEAENKYYEQATASWQPLRETLYNELRSRIKEDDASVPYLYNGYYYITRFEKGKEYPIYSRKKGALDAPEEIMFDCNEMAKGHDYFKLGGIEISLNNRYAAFAIDTVSRRIYTLKIKDLVTGEILSDVIENTTGSSAWANDHQTLFYTRQDPTTLRHDKVYKHVLGANSSTDELVYFEKDETYDVSIYKEKSQQYLVISINSTLTSEVRFLDANMPSGKFKVFQKRMRGVEYSISHFADSFYIVTNADDALNFKVMKTPLKHTKKENWVDVIPHRTETLIEDLDIFKDFLVVTERTKGLSQLQVIPHQGTSYYLPFDNETYTAYTTTNVDFDTSILRYGYQSLTTPPSIIDFNMIDQTFEVKKEQEVLGGQFDKNNYESKRLWATADDGVLIPMSVVYKKGLQLNGKNPVLQYGYGSYGHTIEPSFSSNRLSLLDRGFIFVIAHIRGGEYMGRKWYEDGKLLKKKNTFTDFVACSKHLIEQKYTSASHLYAQGGSAGGLLMGAVINIAPELYNGVIADVPFVDVVTTMLDDSIPLTTSEYDEWGNPNKIEYYDYMKSYSPYDNVTKKSYPNLLVTTGLHDSQVQYWEPAKWVAKLREFKQDNNVLFLETNMKTGHGGASGRLEVLKEIAREFSFLLKLEGIER